MITEEEEEEEEENGLMPGERDVRRKKGGENMAQKSNIIGLKSETDLSVEDIVKIDKAVKTLRQVVNIKRCRLSFYCQKKKKWLTDKRANKKCIRLNIRKRGMVCRFLVEWHDIGYETSAIRR